MSIPKKGLEEPIDEWDHGATWCYNWLGVEMRSIINNLSVSRSPRHVVKYLEILVTIVPILWNVVYKRYSLLYIISTSISHQRYFAFKHRKLSDGIGTPQTLVFSIPSWGHPLMGIIWKTWSRSASNTPPQQIHSNPFPHLGFFKNWSYGLINAVLIPNKKTDGIRPFDDHFPTFFHIMKSAIWGWRNRAKQQQHRLFRLFRLFRATFFQPQHHGNACSQRRRLRRHHRSRIFSMNGDMSWSQSQGRSWKNLRKCWSAGFEDLVL